eukprot:TRINITY_DN8802_c0_g1_i1.p1 TRINITY_DN8802_c0_g1~~TRINITY_DN8802_c0_g1_i1.p1  ORF type:complete len:128 (+),score=22.43 TRINITY_DN8802_c0_g1_i1:52-384(+)
MKEMKLFEKYPVQAWMLYHVYLDLKLVKNWDNAEPFENTELRMCFLRGQHVKGATIETVVPVDSNNSVTGHQLEDMTKNETSSNVVLGCLAGDSTLTYYRLSQGLIIPKE